VISYVSYSDVWEAHHGLSIRLGLFPSFLLFLVDLLFAFVKRNQVTFLSAFISPLTEPPVGSYFPQDAVDRVSGQSPQQSSQLD
jgi:hypothetical protein